MFRPSLVTGRGLAFGVSQARARRAEIDRVRRAVFTDRRLPRKGSGSGSGTPPDAEPRLVRLLPRPSAAPRLGIELRGQRAQAPPTHRLGLRCYIERMPKGLCNWIRPARPATEASGRHALLAECEKASWRSCSQGPDVSAPGCSGWPARLDHSASVARTHGPARVLASILVGRNHVLEHCRTAGPYTRDTNRHLIKPQVPERRCGGNILSHLARSMFPGEGNPKTYAHG